MKTFVEFYRFKTEYKDRTQIGLLTDATKACKARYNNECPKIPDLKQGHILRVMKPISSSNKYMINCFISLKASDDVAHINFVASDKGGGGLFIEDKITALILVACNKLDIKSVHYDLEGGETPKSRAKSMFGYVPCPDYTCYHFHQSWEMQNRVSKVFEIGEHKHLSGEEYNYFARY